MDKDDECLGHVRLHNSALNTHVRKPVENIHQKISMSGILQPQFNSWKL
jgi:hypothetical protein